MNNNQQDIRQWCMTENTTSIHDDETRSNRVCRITLDIVDNDTKRFNFDMIVKNYHTYKPSTDLFGRRIDWLVRCDNKIIGAIGLGSCALAMGPRDRYIGWNKTSRTLHLNNVAVNWRFCLTEDGRGLGSRVLSEFCTQSRKVWKEKFGDTLLMIETLIEPPYTGTSYKASGFVCVGETKGYQYLWKKKTEIQPTDIIVAKNMKFGNVIDESMCKCIIGNNKKKLIFVKPLHRYWKKILMSEK